ncbi:hypothetical protein JL37_15780 [Achromobacter sp. RTa]|uniref:hypothetical protein n=1 Tax=Achromobacter sp. RTa TaxID=1532557 RepID=UPI00050EBCB0|nr:hypothetical protein [Achromobacter sp. RTa]KGD92110.1 hypothetical protein JL37_15780 [Achromobacter sp. RTa]
MRQTARSILLLPALWLAGCAAGGAPVVPKAGLDEAPMYGGADRSAAADLRAADDKLIAEATQSYGSRESASRAWVEQGYRFYQADQLGMAMRRFNQAWLLDSKNPQVYTGFAAVLHDEGRFCDAMNMMDRALSLDPRSFQGSYADAGRTAARCAAEDKTLPPEARVAATLRSDAMFRKGEQLEPDKGYLYASWASAFYRRGQYSDAWAMIFKSRAAGGQPSPAFVEMLRVKMPEPARP